MKLILVAGSWGSGTTAVIGALYSLGVPTLGPYFQSSDPRTRNTFELIAFRDLIDQYVDESTMMHKDNYDDEFLPALEEFKKQLETTVMPDQTGNPERCLALKMPLSSICIPEICKIFNTKLIVVHRPIEEIEASRLRRNWPALFGALGAQHMYGHIFRDIINHKLSFIGISYADFVNETRHALEKIIDFCEIGELQQNLETAEAFVKKPQG